MTTQKNLVGETNKLALAQILLFCLRYTVPPKHQYSEKDMAKRGKLENLQACTKLRGCIDLVEDTEYAILNFCTYQLSQGRKYGEHGEMYLRLYGVLGAVYLQKQAIEEIGKITNYAGLEEIEKLLSNHEALALRHILGAHTLNYKLDYSKNRKFSFRVTQTDIKPDASKISFVTEGKHEAVNLKEVIHDYCSLSEKLLISVVEAYTEKIFKPVSNNGKRTSKELAELKAKPTNYDKFDKTKERQQRKIRYLVNQLK